jgi:ATP-dependent RNA helicase DeaD
MVQSRTGSGKTGAFLLPILDRIDPKSKHCQTLILVPTRELARQVCNEAEILAKECGIRSIAIYGGVGYGPQFTAFREGVQLVVGTPGRVLDHLLKGTLKLDELQILVFDEADRMLSMGFYPDMREVQSYLPRRHVNTFMFSATYPPYVIRLAKQFQRDAEILSLSSDAVHVAETEHQFYVVPGMEKDRCLVRIIEIENPAQAIIFCNTKATVNYVAIVLKRFGYDAEELTADLTQSKREKLMTKVRSGKLRFLVATDLAGRGIDIHELSHVILYEPPEDAEAYIHRAGRTGRAGASGVAISLVSVLEKSSLQRIAKRFGIDMLERRLPSDADVIEIVSERVTALLEAKLRKCDKLVLERMTRFLPLAKSLSQSDEELSVVAMLLDDYYQMTMHGPVEVPLEPSKDSRTKKGDRKPAERSGHHQSGRPGYKKKRY